jgi:hypothetical protein
MITADRFVASKDLNEEAWITARRMGVTATMVSRGATKSGYLDVVNTYGLPVFVNEFMSWGNSRERVIADWVKNEFQIMPNSWLISAGGPMSADRWMLCTPDGLSLTHHEIAEIKTGGTVTPSIRIDHRRQMQWQLFVTDAERCLYVFEHRKTVGDNFEPGEITHEWVYPDPEMRDELIDVAQRLQQELVHRSRDEQPSATQADTTTERPAHE